MNETIYAAMIQDIAIQNANLLVEKSEFKARLTDSLEQLNHFKAVLASNEALKELFEEAEQNYLNKQREEL